jgi:hypothetical protein
VALANPLTFAIGTGSASCPSPPRVVDTTHSWRRFRGSNPFLAEFSGLYPFLAEFSGLRSSSFGTMFLVLYAHLSGGVLRAAARSLLAGAG